MRSPRHCFVTRPSSRLLDVDEGEVAGPPALGLQGAQEGTVGPGDVEARLAQPQSLADAAHAARRHRVGGVDLQPEPRLVEPEDGRPRGVLRLEGHRQHQVEVAEEAGQERERGLAHLLDDADGRAVLVEEVVLVAHLEELAALADADGGAVEEGDRGHASIVGVLEVRVVHLASGSASAFRRRAGGEGRAPCHNRRPRGVDKT